MTRIKLPYYVLRNCRGYFEIGRERAKDTGLLASEPLGEDGPEAWARARRSYEAYLAARDPNNKKRLGGYPPGSFGAAWVLWRGTADWTDKAARTREEYERAWDDHIDPNFGKKQITKITVSDSEAFHRRLQRDISASDAHRTLKIWRALLNMLAKKHIIARAPIGAVTNPMPKGRGQFWLASEIARLLRAAHLLHRYTQDDKWQAMGLLVWLGWETALSPADCRTLTVAMLKRDRSGWYVERERTKTGAEAKPPISDLLADALRAYATRGGRTPLPSANLFHNSVGDPMDRFHMADNFRDLRRVAFGKGEIRQFMDIRRSANLEADLGGASAQDRAAVMANALDKNKSLDAVYTPVTVARARKAQEARGAGRALLAQELGRAKSRKPPAGGV